MDPHPEEQPALGERELDVLQVLWKRGDATVGDVQQSLAAAGVMTTAASPRFCSRRNAPAACASTAAGRRGSIDSYGDQEVFPREFCNTEVR